MAKTIETNYGLYVTLSHADANALTTTTEAGANAAERLSNIATELLRNRAKGGVTLAPEWTERIRAAIGTTDGQAIAANVEKAVGMDGETTVVAWRIDPTQITWFKELAANQGVTLEQHLKAHMDYALMQGWLNYAAPDPFKVLFTQEQYQRLQQMFAKDIVTGDELIAKLGGSAAAAEFVDDGDDLILDALKGVAK